MNELGSYLKEVRVNSKKSIREVAQEIGVSHTELFRIEKGVRENPSPKILESLSKSLDLSYEDLMIKANYISFETISSYKDFNRNRDLYELVFLNSLTPFLLKNKWQIKYTNLLTEDFDIIAQKGRTTWNFLFVSVSNDYKLSRRRLVDPIYGFFSRKILDSVECKNSIVLLDDFLYKEFIKLKPINLNINLSVINLKNHSNDLSLNETMISKYHSKSKI